MAISVLFGELVRHYRLSAKLSQTELARQAGVASSYVTLLETGRRSNPSRKVVSRFVEALGLKGEDAEALYAAAQYVREGQEPVRAESSHPAQQALARLLSLPPRSPELLSAVDNVVREIYGSAVQRGAGRRERTLLQATRLAGIGYFHRTDRGQHKAQRAPNARLSGREAKLLGHVSQLMAILVDPQVPLSKRLRLADELTSLARWKIGSQSGEAADGGRGGAGKRARKDTSGGRTHATSTGAVRRGLHER